MKACKFPAPVLFGISLFAPAKDVRYYLNAVCIQPEDITATNGHILGTYHVKTYLDEGVSMLVPLDAIVSLGRTIGVRGRKEGTISIYCEDPHGEHRMTWTNDAETNSATVLFTPVDGTYPDWHRIMPAAHSEPCTWPLAFNWAYMDTFRKACEFIRPGDRWPGIQLIPGKSSSDAARVLYTDEFEFRGVIMPMRV